MSDAPPPDEEKKQKKKPFTVPIIKLVEKRKSDTTSCTKARPLFAFENTPSGPRWSRHEGSAKIEIDSNGVVNRGVVPHQTSNAIKDEIKRENLQPVRVLGCGASGEVQLMVDQETQKRYAVKIIRLQGAPTMEVHKMIQEEVKRLYDTAPNLVKTLQAYLLDSSLWLVQEFMDFGSLDDILKSCRKLALEVPEGVIAKLIEQMLQGLVYLHKPRDLKPAKGKPRPDIHRDLKPANILINSAGVCKIADFGIASDLATLGQKTFVGTTAYMSPERIKAELYGTPSDVWAIGLICLELSLGKYPFKMGAGIVGLMSEIQNAEIPKLTASQSEEVQDFIHSLMHQNPQERPTASDALEHPFIKKHAHLDNSVVAEWLAKHIAPSLAEDEEPAADENRTVPQAPPAS